MEKSLERCLTLEASTSGIVLTKNDNLAGPSMSFSQSGSGSGTPVGPSGEVVEMASSWNGSISSPHGVGVAAEIRNSEQKYNFLQRPDQ